MKKSLVILASLVLAACSSSEPNLTYSNKPILNITTPLSSQLDAKLSADSAYLKNKTALPLNVTYALYWYDAQGVTQLAENQQERVIDKLTLQPKEQKTIKFTKPTAESQNYRLYLQ